jgi:hypothetical protein
VDFFPRLDQLLGKLLLVAVFFLGVGEFCLQGFDFVEYLLALDVPACNGSFNSHFRWFFPYCAAWDVAVAVPRLHPYILAGGGAVDQGVERVDKFIILVWLDYVGIGA